MSNEKQQTAVEWFEEKFDKYVRWYEGHHAATEYTLTDLYQDLQQAKEIEKQQKNNMPIHIHEGISNTWVYIEDGVVHVKPNDLEMVKQCQFEIDNSTSSATKCKWCGREKWQHETYGGNK
jgi:hypothetical protein